MRQTKITKRRNKRGRRKHTVRYSRQLGGIDAADQGLSGTCYAESATRAIIKILKHPEFRLISDVVSGILSEPLYTKHAKTESDSLEKTETDGKEVYRVKPDIIKVFNQIPKGTHEKTEYLKTHPILKDILNEQNLYYGSLLTCIVQVWGWALGGDPDTVCEKIVKFVYSDKTDFRAWMYKGIILQLRSKPKCVEAKYDMDSSKPDAVIAEKSGETVEAVPKKEPKKKQSLKELALKRIKSAVSNDPEHCKGDVGYFDRMGEMLVQLRSKLTETGWKLEMVSKSITQGDILNPIPPVILDCIKTKLYPILSISMDKTMMGHFQSHPNEINTDTYAKYDSGNISGRKSSLIGHAMIIRKAGYSSDGKGYITLKNSWGTKWGDHGMLTITNPFVFYVGGTQAKPKVQINITSFMLTNPEGKKYGADEPPSKSDNSSSQNPETAMSANTNTNANANPQEDPEADIYRESGTDAKKANHVYSDTKLKMNMGPLTQKDLQDILNIFSKPE